MDETGLSFGEGKQQWIDTDFKRHNQICQTDRAKHLGQGTKAWMHVLFRTLQTALVPGKSGEKCTGDKIEEVKKTH